jgi:hypothetical protein
MCIKMGELYKRLSFSVSLLQLHFSLLHMLDKICDQIAMRNNLNVINKDERNANLFSTLLCANTGFSTASSNLIFVMKLFTLTLLPESDENNIFKENLRHSPLSPRFRATNDL